MAAYRATVDVPYQRAFDPSANLTAANKLFSNISNRIQGRAVNKLLGEYTPTGDMMTDSNTLLKSLTDTGVSPMEALGLVDKAMTPAYKQMAYDKGQYGFTTDDLGNVYQTNRNTGDVNTVAGGYDIYNSPRNTVLKTVTNRDGSGVETTTQVPVNKLTGQPVNTQQSQTQPPVDAEQVRAKSFLQTKGLTEDQYAALPEADKVKLDEEFNVYEMPTPQTAASISVPAQNAAVGVKMPKDSAAQTKSMEEMKAIIGPFERIKNTYNPGWVGPFDSRVEGAKSNLGMGNKKFNEFQGNLRQMTNVTRHALFGGALTEQEIAEWNRAAPTDRANETEFVPKYNAFVDMSVDKMNVAKQRYLDQGNVAKANEVQNVIDSMQTAKLGTKQEKVKPEDNPYGNDYTVIKF